MCAHTAKCDTSSHPHLQVAATSVLDVHILLKQLPASRVIKLSTVMLYPVFGIRSVALYELQLLQVSFEQVEEPRGHTVIRKLKLGFEEDHLKAMLELVVLFTDTSVAQGISKKGTTNANDSSVHV